jgi:hypothetical protein
MIFQFVLGRRHVADRGLDADLGEPLAVADRQVLPRSLW